MKKLERRELEAINRMHGLEDFQTFITILKDSATELSLLNSKVESDVQTRWNQGKVQELLDILKKIDDTTYNLERIHK